MKKKRIFISWSKKTSKEIAEILHEFLLNFFLDPNIDFFLSSTKIDAGGRPIPLIEKNLERSHFGILILTKRNYKSEWLMFEAGALSKEVERSKIIPILFNRNSTRIESPIKTFQYIKYDKNGIYKLLISIKKEIYRQNALTKKQEEDFKEKLDKYWKDFRDKIDKVIDKSEVESIDEFGVKVPELMMNENAYEKVLSKRDNQLKELIDNLKNDNSNRIIILGGISTRLRKEETIRAFAKWLIDNPKSKLFICYENVEVVKHRAKDLRQGVFAEGVDNNDEILKRKVEKFKEMKQNLLSTVANRYKKNIHFIEIIKSLSVYVIIQETTMYLTPVLDKRSSNTFTFKLKQTKLIEDILDYMCLKIDKKNVKNNDLIKEIDKIKNNG